jgi:hypothetical protein
VKSVCATESSLQLQAGYITASCNVAVTGGTVSWTLLDSAATVLQCKPTMDNIKWSRHN